MGGTVNRMSDTPLRISQFDLQARLSSGERCDVFEGSYTRDDGRPARAAVKVLRASLACVGEELRSFLQEISWARKVHHRMFPQIIEAGESEGSYFLAMELVDGWTLAELLDTAKAQGVAVPSYVGLIIAHRLAVGTQELHEWYDEASTSGDENSGLIHQGINPSNIMIHRTGSVSLLDFGSIKSGSQEDEFPAEVMELQGDFHAPERFNGFSSTPQSDVYSLGRVFESMMAQMDPGALSEDGESLIERACHTVATSRYTSMAEFARAIEDVAEHRNLPLSKEVCANFAALVFGADVRRAFTGQHVIPKKKAFFHTDSEHMKTVVQTHPDVQRSPVSNQDPILLSPNRGRATTDVDELDYEDIETSQPDDSVDQPLDDATDWPSDEEGEAEATDVTGEVKIGELEELNPFEDIEELEEIEELEDIEELDGLEALDAIEALVESSEELAKSPVQTREPTGSGEMRQVSPNLVPQGASSNFSNNEHQEATAFMPAEAMAAMASRGSRAPTEMESAPKKKKKKAFPQELIPTRAYQDSDAMIRALTKAEDDSDD